MQAQYSSAKLARNPLSNEQLLRLAPSIFATDAHESRSARFAPIPTIAVVNALRDAGFAPVHATQSKTRDASRVDFTKHMIRFKQPNGLEIVVGNTYPELCLVNAQDGSSAYKLYAGLFRTTCSNGMIMKSSAGDEISVRHSGDVRQPVIDASFSVVNTTKRALAVIPEWSRLELAPEERATFASAPMLSALPIAMAISIRLSGPSKCCVLAAQKTPRPIFGMSLTPSKKTLSRAA